MPRIAAGRQAEAFNWLARRQQRVHQCVKCEPQRRWNLGRVAPTRHENVCLCDDAGRVIVDQVAEGVFDSRQLADVCGAVREDVADDEAATTPALRKPSPFADSAVIAAGVGRAWVDAEKREHRAAVGNGAIEAVAVHATAADNGIHGFLLCGDGVNRRPQFQLR